MQSIHFIQPHAAALAWPPSGALPLGAVGAEQLITESAGVEQLLYC